MKDEPRGALEEVLKPVKRVRFRWRLQQALDLGTLGFAGGIVVLAFCLVLYKLGIASDGLLLRLMPLYGGLLGLGVAAGFLQRPSLVTAAARLDRQARLKDRLGNAVLFACMSDPTPGMKATIVDAAKFSSAADPKRAYPLRTPHRFWLLPTLVAVSLIVYLFPYWEYVSLSQPLLGASAPGPHAVKKKADPADEEESPDDQQLLEQQIERLRNEMHQTEDKEAREWLAKLQQLLKEVKEGRVAVKDAFKKLSELEAEREAKRIELERQMKEQQDELREMGKELQRHKATRELGKALQKNDLKRAAKELDKLLSKQMGKRKLEKMAKAFEQAAKRLEKRHAEKMKDLKDKIAKLEQKQRRLQRRNKDLSSAEKRRLNRHRKQLKRLTRRQKEQQQPQRKMLKRLRRNLQRAESDLKRQKKIPKDLLKKLQQQAQDDLRRLRNRSGTSKVYRLGEVKIIDIKDWLRQQAKKCKKCKGKGCDKCRNQGMQKLRQLAREGQRRQLGAGRKQLWRKQRRGGKPTLILGLKGNKRVEIEIPSPDGIGDKHDPKVLGKKDRLKGVKPKDTFQPGQDGKGPEKVEVVWDAARKGFVTRSYRVKYQDYRGEFEEQLDKQKIPEGYRRYVMRYLRIIRPRGHAK